jgi:hypothetical protein
MSLTRWLSNHLNLSRRLASRSKSPATRMLGILDGNLPS